MNKVCIVADPVNVASWEIHDTDKSICAFLASRFDSFPTGAKLYHTRVDGEHDITPVTVADLPIIEKMTGDFWVLQYPQDPITIAVIVAIAVAAVSIGLSLLLRPKPTVQTQPSPNNTLQDRSNQARPNARIPDIVGTVRSIPDLIATPYREYINSQEVEICYMCIGRGSYDIHDMKDNTANYTRNNVSEITGSSFEVYGPNTSPNSGDAPILRIGTPINRHVIAAQPLDLVNGQLLIAPNANTVRGNSGGSDTIQFIYPDTIEINDSTIDLTQYFVPNQGIIVTGATGNQNGISFDLSGSYTILSVTSNQIILANPASINAQWNAIQACNYNAVAGATDYTDATLQNNSNNWVGPFYLNVGNMTEVWCNFVAPNGAYYLDGDGNQHRVDVGIAVQITALDDTGAPSGLPLTYTATLPGSAKVRNQRAITIKCPLPSAGPVQVQVRRTTNMQIDKNDQVSDQTQWADCYAMSPVPQNDFGDITTVQTMSYATEAALTEKERKFNALVTRQFPQRSGNGFTTTKRGTNNGADIFCALALDPYVGNRSLAELDVAGIYAAFNNVQGTFGSTLATEFCYTYDDANRSFEEIATDIANAVGCTVFRRGKLITMSFERQSIDATLLFNHRNKQPRSETRTVTFGFPSNNDGITFEYVNPNTPNYPNVDTPQSIYFPRDGSAKNPKKIQSVGIRNTLQAMMIGWRAYQKMIYQNTACKFTATREAALCAQNERVLVADNTRSDTLDGEIIGIDSSGLVLTLSRMLPTAGLAGTIWVQMPSGNVDAVPFSQPPTQPLNIVTLGAPLSEGITADQNKYAQPTFMMTIGTPARTAAMLISENNPQDGMLQEVTCYNYDARYYAHDSDAINGIVPSDSGQYDQYGNYLGGVDGSTGGNPVNPIVYPNATVTTRGNAGFTSSSTQALSVL